MEMWKHVFSYNLSNDQPVWGWFSWEHIMMLIICLAIIFSLYLFPKYYAWLSKTNFFLYFIGGAQIFLMIYLRIIQAANISNYINNNENWSGIIPLDFCAMTQILSIAAVFSKNTRFFSIIFLYPFLGSSLAILMPSGQVETQGPDTLRFYEYFFAHFLSMFIILYSYLYSKRTYETKYWKESALYLFIYSLCMFVVNTIFNTDFMFMGNDQSVGPVDFLDYLPASLHSLGAFLNLSFTILVVGIVGLSIVYWMFKLLKPIYDENQVLLHLTWCQILSNKIKKQIQQKNQKPKTPTEIEEFK